MLRVCTSTSHFDLLYNTVYRILEKDPLARSIFLELLEEFVSDGLLDQPPPALIHDFLSHLIAEGSPYGRRLISFFRAIEPIRKRSYECAHR